MTPGCVRRHAVQNDLRGRVPRSSLLGRAAAAGLRCGPLNVYENPVLEAIGESEAPAEPPRKTKTVHIGSIAGSAGASPSLSIHVRIAGEVGTQDTAEKTRPWHPRLPRYPRYTAPAGMHRLDEPTNKIIDQHPRQKYHLSICGPPPITFSEPPLVWTNCK